MKSWIVIFLVLFLTGCAPTPTPLPSATVAPVQTNTVLPSTTPSPSVTPSVTVTPLPTVTHTASPTFTPTPLPNPLSIAAMRQAAYPGSTIVIEKTLEPGANYNRYLASYLSEGLKIYALLTVPRGAKPASGWPVIVFNHGYIPPAAYRTTERYVAHVDVLARGGYIVYKPDYRGHGSSEGEARGGYGTPDYTVDVLNALASIRQYKDADPGRMGMWGHSMGGHITLRAMVVSKEIKAGVIWAGVVASYPDLITKWRSPVPTEIPRSSLRWREDLEKQYGTFASNPQFWASISPISYVADLSGPLQLHHGTKDADVPYDFSKTLNEEVKKAGKPVEFYTYEGDDHNLLKNFNLAIYRSLEFFNNNLK